MYRSDVEAMPRELKDALLSNNGSKTDDEIVSFIDVDSSEDVIKQFQESLSDIDLPDYWIVSLPNDGIYGLFYLVFETQLTEEAEQKFFTALPYELSMYLGNKSLFSGHSIY